MIGQRNVKTFPRYNRRQQFNGRRWVVDTLVMACLRREPIAGMEIVCQGDTTSCRVFVQCSDVEVGWMNSLVDLASESSLCRLIDCRWTLVGTYLQVNWKRQTINRWEAIGNRMKPGCVDGRLLVGCEERDSVSTKLVFCWAIFSKDTLWKGLFVEISVCVEALLDLTFCSSFLLFSWLGVGSICVRCWLSIVDWPRFNREVKWSFRRSFKASDWTVFVWFDSSWRSVVRSSSRWNAKNNNRIDRMSDEREIAQTLTKSIARRDGHQRRSMHLAR